MSEMHDLSEARKFDAALWDQMGALVRRMAEREEDRGGCLNITAWMLEADAISAALPAPVDPDLIEARKINDSSPYDLTEMDPRAAQRVVNQVQDAILAGIKLGRALATPATSA